MTMLIEPHKLPIIGSKIDTIFCIKVIIIVLIRETRKPFLCPNKLRNYRKSLFNIGLIIFTETCTIKCIQGYRILLITK